MNVKRSGRLCAAAVALAISLLAVPTALWAQAATGAIAGTVRDASGAVLPGVTVEAASPALIEKVRTVVTDAQGEYRIVELRPGAYTVTFTLPGFNTVKREGLELTSSFTATVNAELRVGGVEETITVTGETPVVDLSSARQSTTVARETLEAIPTTKRLGQYAAIIPGATYQNSSQQDVGGTAGEGGTFAVHGQRVGDQSTNVDGQAVNVLNNDVISINTHTVQEVVVETGATSAESQTGGVQVNIIPKDGGNNFSGTFSGSWTGPEFAADNLSDTLRARGLTSGASIKNFMDVGGGLGGPIKQNRMWFFTAHRVWSSSKYIQGAYYNKNQGATRVYVDQDPLYNVSLYEPDLERQAHTGWEYYNNDLRLTWQATPRNKFVATMARNSICNCPIQLSGTGGSNAIKRAPEGAIRHMFVPMYLPAVTWSSPVSSKLLLEAGVSGTILSAHSVQMEGVQKGDIQITDLGQNIIYGSAQATLRRLQGSYNTRFALSYVTGSHAAKFGFIHRFNQVGKEGRYTDPDTIFGGRTYTFRNGVPQSVTIYAQPFDTVEETTNLGIFAQDQWRLRKLTLNYGLRYDGYVGSVPEHSLPAGYFVPARTFPAVSDIPNFKNLNTRASGVYDVFGNGKTALKASIGRYNPLEFAAVNNPARNLATNTTRTWTDANGNYVPDCDLNNPQVNGECGVWSDLSFGQSRPGTRWADDAISGFNKQFYNWQASASLQQELVPGVALNVGYFRTWYGNFLVTDNEALTAADFDTYCITRPRGASQGGYVMPGAGEQICGFYDMKPEAASRRPDLVRKPASTVGNRTEVYNGVDVTLQARFGQGGLFSGGLNIGRTTTDACDIGRNAPETMNGTDGSAAGGGTNTGPGTLTTGVAGAWTSIEHCRIAMPWLAGTQVKFMAVYPLPWQLQFSAIYQNMAGQPIMATYPAPAAEVISSLPGNRTLGACAGRPTCTVATTVSLVSPGEAYENRLQQLDLRFSRRFEIGGTTLRANADLANVTNRGDIYSANTGYGPNWLVPYEVAGGRILRLTGALEF